MNSRRPPPPLSGNVLDVNTYGMDWELREGPALRIAEATAAAERDRLVRELRAARRARRDEGAGGRTRRGWGWRRFAGGAVHHLPGR